MNKIIFILGGVRSGKSIYALKLVKRHHKKVAFIATCQPKDLEMRHRIELHKKIRPGHWQTFEESQEIAPVLKTIGDKFECIIIDCLTLLVSNLILTGCSQNLIEKKVNDMMAHLKKIKGKAIIISNEVGMGIVPANKLARNFRDIAGKINQIVARKSNEVYFMVSGIPWKIK